jgi:hypothetical protein
LVENGAESQPYAAIILDSLRYKRHGLLLKKTKIVPVQHESLSLPIPGSRTALLICRIHGISLNAIKEARNRI